MEEATFRRARYDVIVLGGGIIGCAIAEELAQRGQSVALIERGTIGCEASKAAAGILSAQMDLEKPDAFFELCQASRRMYPRWVKHLERQSGIDVEYHQDGLLYLALTEGNVRTMTGRMRWQHRRGLAVERWSRTEVLQREPSANRAIRAGFFFPTEAQLDNTELMEALARACKKARVAVLERTAIRKLLIRHRNIVGVQTDRYTLNAPVVVNCLGSWAGSLGRAFLDIAIVPVKGQILVFDAPTGLLRHVVISKIGSGVAYGVQRRNGELLVGSTVEFVGFDRRVTLEGMRRILSGFRKIASPAVLERCAFKEAWAGFRPLSKDGLPILGKTSIEGLYVALGHFRHGILLAPITAKLLAELILTGYLSLELVPFSPGRFHQ